MKLEFIVKRPGQVRVLPIHHTCTYALGMTFSGAIVMSWNLIRCDLPSSHTCFLLHTHTAIFTLASTQCCLSICIVLFFVTCTRRSQSGSLALSSHRTSKQNHLCRQEQHADRFFILPYLIMMSDAWPRIIVYTM